MSFHLHCCLNFQSFLSHAGFHCSPLTGIELHADAIEHCKQAIASWKNESLEAQKIHQINIIHGNALHLDVGVGECALGFDRIYIGASIEVAQLPMFKNLLKLGGILVGPVDGDLLKVVRLETPICNAGTEPQEYTEEVLSPVRFAPLVSYPRMGTVIPARVWTPSLHQFYPDSFQKSCKTILLCSRSNYVQPIEPRPKENVNIAAMLPPALWLEILSYTRRDCKYIIYQPFSFHVHKELILLLYIKGFEAPLSEVEDLRRRLRKEQEIAERASRASVEANARCHLAERERDLYKSMLLRLRRRMRIRSIVLDEDEDTEMDSLDDAATSMLLGGHGSLSMIGLAQLFRSARDQAINFAESDNENDSEDESHEAHNTNGMDEDEEMVDYDDDDESSASAIEDHHESDESSIVHGPLSDPSDLIVTRQVRTVSITGTDV